MPRWYTSKTFITQNLSHTEKNCLDTMGSSPSDEPECEELENNVELNPLSQEFYKQISEILTTELPHDRHQGGNRD
jgi:hypothetical protein